MAIGLVMLFRLLPYGLASGMGFLLYLYLRRGDTVLWRKISMTTGQRLAGSRTRARWLAAVRSGIFSTAWVVTRCWLTAEVMSSLHDDLDSYQILADKRAFG